MKSRMQEKYLERARSIFREMKSCGTLPPMLSPAERAELRERIIREVNAEEGLTSPKIPPSAPQDGDHGTLADKLPCGAAKGIDGDIAQIKSNLNKAKCSETLGKILKVISEPHETADHRLADEKIAQAREDIKALEVRLKIAESTRRSWKRFECEEWVKEHEALLTMTAKPPEDYDG